MSTTDKSRSTDPTRGRSADKEEQPTDPTGGVSANDPSRLPPDPTAPSAGRRDEPAENERESES
jgi:hypothetical protein